MHPVARESPLTCLFSTILQQFCVYAYTYYIIDLVYSRVYGADYSGFCVLVWKSDRHKSRRSVTISVLLDLMEFVWVSVHQSFNVYKCVKFKLKV